jgi:ankyrin repeat protein
VVRTLLEIGADPHTLPGTEHTGPDKPIKIARSAGAMRALVEAGADPSAPDEFGQTVMQTAAGLPADVAEVLLNAGVPVDMPVDSFGHTALMRAAAEGNIGVVRLLLSAGATPALRTVAGSAALDIARDAKEQQERSRVPASLRTTAFEQDFDAVIVALEQALAPQQR